MSAEPDDTTLRNVLLKNITSLARELHNCYDEAKGNCDCCDTLIYQTVNNIFFDIDDALVEMSKHRKEELSDKEEEG